MLHDGNAILVNDEYLIILITLNTASILSHHTAAVRQLARCLGYGVESLVLCALHCLYLHLARVPVDVDARLPALPHHVVFLFLSSNARVCNGFARIAWTVIYFSLQGIFSEPSAEEVVYGTTLLLLMLNGVRKSIAVAPDTY